MSSEERGLEARREELRWSAIVERVALGGSMSPEEASFCREFEAERAAWQGLIAGLRAGAAAGAAASEAEDLAILARAQATLSGGAPSARQPEASPSLARRGWRWTGVAAAVGLAAAAGLVGLWIQGADDRGAPGAAPSAAIAPPPTGRAARAPAPEPALAPRGATHRPVLIAMSSGEGISSAAGEALAVGERVAEGGVIEARGEACLVMHGPLAVVCVDAGGRARIDAAAGPSRRITLERGRLVAALDPLPSGHTFVVASAAGEARAVGTIFAVEVGASEVGVGVLEGVVEVRSASRPALRLTASQHAQLGPWTVGALPPSLAAWAGARAQLGALWREAEGLGALLFAAGGAGSSALDGIILAPGTDEILAPAGPHTLRVSQPGRRARSIAALAIAGERSAVETGDGRAAPARTGQLVAGGATLVELREAARVARTAGRWQAAADAYGELLERFPGSPEAHNARVQLGDLLRVRLGDPARALGHYQAYVARGGPLDAEARFGAILCLRRLGEEAAASHATEEFLARYPNHLEAAELRAP